MGIYFNKEKSIFTLYSRHFCYQMHIDSFGVLQHRYAGQTYAGMYESAPEPDRCDRGFSGQIAEAGTDRTYSLDVLPQEYPHLGSGDYRILCLQAGSQGHQRALDLRVSSWEILPGKYAPQSWPSLRDDPGQTQQLRIRLQDREGKACVLLWYNVFEAYDVISRGAVIENTGDDCLHIYRAMSLCLDFPEGEDIEVLHFPGRYAMERIPEKVRPFQGRMQFASGRGFSSHQENPGILLTAPGADENNGSCLGISLIYSGSFEIWLEKDPLGQLRLTAGISGEGLDIPLDKGECFETPEALMAFSSSGCGDLSEKLGTCYRRLLLPVFPAGTPSPVLINSWEAAYFHFTGSRFLQMAACAARLGVELFVLDDGWFGHREDDTSSLGDWQVNEDKLGMSLGEFSGRLRGLGLQFGLWIEPEMVSRRSRLFQTHPDWVLMDPDRSPVVSRSQLVLDLGRQDVQDYLLDCIRDLLDQADISYLKWDANRSISAAFSQERPLQSPGLVSLLYIKGLYRILKTIRQEYPDLLIEGCAGGGGRFDPGMLAFCPQIWCSDNTDPISRLFIQYGTSFLYPMSAVSSHVSASPCHQTGRSTPLHTRIISALQGAFGFEMDPACLTPEEQELCRRAAYFYRRYRDIFRVGSCRRLISPLQEAGAASWMYISEDREKAVLSAVWIRAQANPLPVRIHLQGLLDGRRYRICLQEDICGRPGSGCSGGIFYGESLMTAGILLPSARQDYDAFLWTLQVMPETGADF